MSLKVWNKKHWEQTHKCHFYKFTVYLYFTLKLRTLIFIKCMRKPTCRIITTCPKDKQSQDSKSI